MKKLLIYCVTLSIAAISGAVVLKGLQERQLTNSQLVANEQALAQDPPNDKDEELDGGGGPGSGTCGYISWTGDTWACECNVNYDIAYGQFVHWGRQKNWCCDGCQGSSYCGNNCSDYIM